jgi:ABC-type branched-subunit amino acid transport system ATPase component
MGFTLEVDNYRALRKVRWSPSGVCAITGPNGAGKTTLLSVPEFLRQFLQRGSKAAIRVTGGTASIRHQLAGHDDDILIRLKLGECTWTTVPTLSAPSIAVGEVIEVHDNVVAEWGPGMDMVRILNSQYQYAEESLLGRARAFLEKPMEAVEDLFRLVAGL